VNVLPSIIFRSYRSYNGILRASSNSENSGKLFEGLLDDNKTKLTSKIIPDDIDIVQQLQETINDKKKQKTTIDSKTVSNYDNLDDFSSEDTEIFEFINFIQNSKGSDDTQDKGDGEIEQVPKFWPLYPKKIKQWVLFTKTPKGFYNFSGKWSISDIFEDQFVPAEDTPEKLKSWEEIFLREQNELPEDLRGRFRFGVTFDQIKDYHPKLRRLFSMTFATPGEILQVRKRNAIIKWGAHATDTASDAVLVDILTLRIRSLQNHLKTNRQDKNNKRALEILTRRRKVTMIRLKKRDPHTYFSVLREIKLKDLYHVWDFRVH